MHWQRVLPRRSRGSEASRNETVPAQYLDEALLRHLSHHRFSHCTCPLAATPQHLLYARSACIRSRFPARRRVLDQTNFSRTFASMQPLLQ